MVQTFSDTVQMRAGATPQTFDGAQTLRLNERAKKIVSLEMSQSQSVRTTDEGSAVVVRLSSSNWNGNRYFLIGNSLVGGPATNCSVGGAVKDIIALDIDVQPNTTVLVDITEALGATQTGTHDVVIEFTYADGAIPADVKAAIEGRAGCPSVKGGTYNYIAGQTLTAETPLTANAGALVNIPSEANEIVGIGTAAELDGAVTADEEIAGFIRTDYGLTNQGDQKYTIPGSMPGDGTEVDGCKVRNVSRKAIYLQAASPRRELQVRNFINLFGASTGGVGIVINHLWR